MSIHAPKNTILGSNDFLTRKSMLSTEAWISSGMRSKVINNHFVLMPFLIFHAGGFLLNAKDLIYHPFLSLQEYGIRSISPFAFLSREQTNYRIKRGEKTAEGQITKILVNYDLSDK